jgi:hypothetical protein
MTATSPQFDDDIDAVVNERLGLTEQDDAAILDRALSSLDNLRAFSAMRKFPEKSSGKTTRLVLPQGYTETLRRAKEMRQL